MHQQPTCGICGKVMTPENSTVSPEFFLCDDCAQKMKIRILDCTKGNMTYRIHIRSVLSGFLAEVQDLDRAHTIHVEGRTLRDIMELSQQAIEMRERQKKERRENKACNLSSFSENRCP